MINVGDLIAFLRLKDELSPELKKVQGSFSSFAGSATLAGAALTAGLTAPIVGVGTAAASSAISFESAFAGVIKTVNDATDAQGALTDVGRELRQGFLDLSQEIPITANELAGVGEAAGQLGIQTDNILGFTETMAQLGVTTNLAADEAATQLARLANITQLPQDQFDELGSTIVDLGNNFATTEAEITSMGLRLAGAGEQIGLTEAQILGFSTALTSVGINAEAGGTAFSRVMKDMNAAVELGGKSFEVFADVAGNSAESFAELFREAPQEALIQFVEGLSRLEERGMVTSVVLEDLELDGIRVSDALIRSANAGDLMREAIELGSVAWEENTALLAEAETRFATTESQMLLLKNELTAVAIELGDALLPMVQSLVSAFSENVVPAIQAVVTWFADLSPTMQGVIVAGAALVAVLGPLLVAVGAVAAGAAALIPVVTAVGAAIGAISLPVAAVGAALVGLVAIWVAWGDDITRIVSETVFSIRQWLVETYQGSVVEAWVEANRAMWELIIAMFLRGVEMAQETYTGIKLWLLDNFGPVIEGVRALLQANLEFWQGVGTAIVGIARDMYEGIRTWLVDRFTSIVDGVREKLEAVTGFFQTLKDRVVGNSIVPDMVDLIGREVDRLDENFVGVVHDQTLGPSGVASHFDALRTRVSCVVSDLFGAGCDVPVISDLGMGLMNSIINEGLTSVEQLFADWADRVIGMLSSWASRALGIIGSVASRLGGSIGAAGAALGGVVGAVAGPIAAGVGVTKIIEALVGKGAPTGQDHPTAPISIPEIETGNPTDEDFRLLGVSRGALAGGGRVTLNVSIGSVDSEATGTSMVRQIEDTMVRLLERERRL